MKALIEYIVSNIVNHPEAVVISETQVEDGMTKYIIEVDPEDVGRVIGKQGKVIKSIRQIVRVSAIQKGMRVIVDLKEDERSRAATQESADKAETTEEVAETTEEETVETPEVTEEAATEVVEETTEEVAETPEAPVADESTDE